MNDEDFTFDILLKEKRNGVVFLTMNNPSKFNLLSESMLRALQAELDEIREDTSTKCLVVAGAGKAFCAGHDLKEMRSSGELDYYKELFKTCSQVMQSIVSLPVPVIARVQGIAAAAGCQLVASCDLAIASQAARFAVSGINVGLFCSTPAVALSRNISSKRAFDMLCTGSFIDAETALDWGLVSQVVAEHELDEAIEEKLKQILSKSSKAIRYGKSMFHAQRQMPLADAYSLAGDAMAKNMMELDTCEGIDAFLEKRTPVFS